MSPQLIFGGIIAAGLLSAGGWFTYRWVEAELITARNIAKEERQNAVNAASRAKNIMEALSASEAISKKRAKERDNAEEEALVVKRAFLELYSQSQSAKDWGEGIIPDDVRLLRRKLAGCPADLSMQCPAGAVGANASPADEGSDKQRPKGRSGFFTERLTTLQ